MDQTEQDREIPFLLHIKELRKRLIISLIAVLIGFVFSYIYADKIFNFLFIPLKSVLPEGSKNLYFTGIAEPFFLFLKLAFISGIFIASPVILYQLWLFIRPGLYEKEKKFTILFVSFGTLFFIGGALFGYFIIFPNVFRFFLGFSSSFMSPIITINEYFSLAVSLLLIFGFLFELPLVMCFLIILDILPIDFFKKNRRYAVVTIIIFAAIVTPTTDALTLILLSIPLIFLYELGIIFSILYKKLA
ncbi:MAG: twin-arginine translocase subunit TatC [Deltaproteobacteria bacterium]|nr:twin-arginine translocase subunit TatC [Deltaproteobacteria bacterium]